MKTTAASVGCMVVWHPVHSPCRTHLQRLALAQLFAGTSVKLSLAAGLPWAASVTDGERHLHSAAQISVKHRLQHPWAPPLGTSLVFGLKQR